MTQLSTRNELNTFYYLLKNVNDVMLITYDELNIDYVRRELKKCSQNQFIK